MGCKKDCKMKNLLKQLWRDESGIVVSTELVFVASIAGIGMIVGLSAARDGVTSELADVGASVQQYNQGYQVAGIQGHGASVAGSRFQDNTDYCDQLQDVATKDEGCIARVDPATAGESDASATPSIIP